MVAKELTKAAGLENIFSMLNKADKRGKPSLILSEVEI